MKRWRLPRFERAKVILGLTPAGDRPFHMAEGTKVVARGQETGLGTDIKAEKPARDATAGGGQSAGDSRRDSTVACQDAAASAVHGADARRSPQVQS